MRGFIAMTTMTSKRAICALSLLTLAACGLTVPPPPARAADAPPVTFSKDVAPILFTHCVTCHRPGEVAPFTLTSYKDAKKRVNQIVEVTQDRQMPPWKAAPGHGEFVGSRRLSDEQVATIKAWADAGAPEGDAAD